MNGINIIIKLTVTYFAALCGKGIILVEDNLSNKDRLILAIWVANGYIALPHKRYLYFVGLKPNTVSVTSLKRESRAANGICSQGATPCRYSYAQFDHLPLLRSMAMEWDADPSSGVSKEDLRRVVKELKVIYKSGGQTVLA